MSRKKDKRQVEHEECVETLPKVRKKQMIGENSDDEAEKTLERLVFGCETDAIRELEKLENEVSVDDDSASEEDDEVVDELHYEIKKIEGRQPAWEDDADDEERIEISSESRLKKLRDGADETVVTGKKFTQKLKRQFERIYGDASWADLDKKARKDSESDDDEEEENSVLKRAGNLLTGKSDNLPRGFLDIARTKDANIDKPSNAALQCVEFHPSAKVLLTAGFNKTLDLFQIDGQNNPKLQSIFLERFPIHTAHFTADGEQVILASQRRSLYVYDMIKGSVIKIPRIRGREEKHFDKFVVSPDGKHLVFLGSNGYLILLSSKTKQWVDNLKMNGSVDAVAFNADGSRMFSAGGDGEVYVWNMNTRSCVHKFRDEGCLNSTTLAASADGQYLACGSDSGVVNIYDEQYLHQTQPKPLKAVMNLTTSVNKALFNSTSEILAISSKVKKDCFKMVHLPSLTVFSNWPTSRTPLRYVHTFDFSPNSGYLSIGNDRGKALLFRLKHYKDS